MLLTVCAVTSICLSLLSGATLGASAADSIDGRYSFSLTTFDPTGKLRQVERATRASSLGPPVLAAATSDGSVVMASPQTFASPLVIEDGTRRFDRITRRIAVAHSGLTADGRVVVAAAQKMAVDHAYTFDEEIPVGLLLENLGLVFQDYTMRPGARPFGCSLLVACLPPEDDIAMALVEDGEEHLPRPQLYRIDPSGSVVSLGSIGMIGNPDEANEFASKMLDESSGVDLDGRNNNLGSAEEVKKAIVDGIKESLDERKKAAGGTSEQNKPRYVAIATLIRDGGLSFEKVFL